MENKEESKKEETKQPVYYLNGDAYADKLIITTRMKISLWQRIKALFKSVLVVEHLLYLKELAPKNIGTQYGYKFMTEAEYKKMNVKK